MQLLCNGVQLDLYNDFKLQLKHINPLFAFDKLECERTTEFKLPTTPTNDRVLSLARIPAYNGVGMMVKFPAELQAGAIVMSGYMYVRQYDGKDYTAVLTVGDMVGLLRLKEAGKLPDLVGNDNATFGVIEPYGATYTLIQTLGYANRLQNVGGVSRYGIESAKCRPCISLYMLAVSYIMQMCGVGVNNMPMELRDLVYLPEKYVDSDGETITTQGTACFAKYGVPEWSLSDLIKQIAYAGAYSLDYDGSELHFLNSTSQLGRTIDITRKLTKRGNVIRSVGSMAQHNRVVWKDYAEYRLGNYLADYTITNNNIQADNTLFTIDVQPAQHVTAAQIEQVVALCWDKFAIDAFTGRDIVPLGKEWLAFMELGSRYLKPYATYPQVPTNSLVKAITDTATQIDIEARMTMQEYNDILNKDCIQVDNSVYVWTERSWQNDTAKFTLSKIS